MNIAEQFGVSHKYHQIGFFEDLPKFYSIIDIVVSAALEEGFNLPPLEAAACGTPFILSDVPIHREIYEGYGFLADFKTSLWDQAIKETLDNDPFRDARRKLVEKYTWANRKDHDECI